MADALITDEEISILCDVLEGQGANFSASKKNVLDQLLLKDSSPLQTKGYLPIANLPAKLNNSSPSAALD
jgi:hypothetical protein